MPRASRKAPGGQVYHVLNRSVGRMHLFGKNADFEAFQRVMIEAHQRHPIPILSYCVMSNHWHFVVWPETDGQVTAFFGWLAQTHAMRWRVAHRTVGYGHLDQGRFNSFPVQGDEHLLTVLRYVEQNAVGAGRVARAEDWRWCGLWARNHGDDTIQAMLAPWPVQRPVEEQGRQGTTDGIAVSRSRAGSPWPFRRWRPRGSAGQARGRCNRPGTRLALPPW